MLRGGDGDNRLRPVSLDTTRIARHKVIGHHVTRHSAHVHSSETHPRVSHAARPPLLSPSRSRLVSAVPPESPISLCNIQHLTLERRIHIQWYLNPVLLHSGCQWRCDPTTRRVSSLVRDRDATRDIHDRCGAEPHYPDCVWSSEVLTKRQPSN